MNRPQKQTVFALVGFYIVGRGLSSLRLTSIMIERIIQLDKLEFDEQGGNAIMMCKIEILSFQNEEAWMIKIPEKTVPHFVVQFAALHLGVIETMKLVDKASDCTINIYQNSIGHKAEYKICLNQEEYPISQTSLEAIAALMIRNAINGWSETAHIDIDITEYISLCFTIEPPL